MVQGDCGLGIRSGGMRHVTTADADLEINHVPRELAVFTDMNLPFPSVR